MSKSKESWNKKEREKKKEKEKKAKEEKKQERKEHSKSGKNLNDMMAYIDENGNISSTPPDPSKFHSVNVEDIQIGVPKYVDDSSDDPVRTGTVVFFNSSRGFGFIKDDVTRESFFVHANGLIDQIEDNNRVSFELENSPRGKSAVGVKLANS